MSVPRSACLARLLVLALAGTALLVVPVAAASAALPAHCSQSGATISCTYGIVHAEQSFVVPDGVTQVQVTAAGSEGSAGPRQQDALGGRGALVTGALAVTPGTVLYVAVGDDAGGPDGSGFNGGGLAVADSNGGGASDVRTVSRADTAGTLTSRLLVAAGGGGSAAAVTIPGHPEHGYCGGLGGDAGTEGGDATCGIVVYSTVDQYTGGGAGTPTAGGAGGQWGGGAGVLGSGGSAGSNAGGGGGGLWGGGGGARGCCREDSRPSPGGGGGGSSLVPTGGTVTLDDSRTPRVVISWTDPSAAAPTVAGGAPAGAVGSPYDFSYSLTGSPAPTTTITGGALPPGVALDSAGRLTGTPSVGGTFSFTVTATNAVAPDASVLTTMMVTGPPTITGAPPSAGAGAPAVGEPYSFAFTVTGGPTPTVTVSPPGSLPPGLVLSTRGVLSGRPTAAGSYPFTVHARNGQSPDASRAVTVVVRPLPGLRVQDASVVEGNSGTRALRSLVTLSRTSTVDVTVRWATRNGSATAGSDFIGASGLAKILAGQRSATVSVQVLGDRAREASEAFSVVLSSPVRAAVVDGVGRAGIANDD